MRTRLLVAAVVLLAAAAFVFTVADPLSGTERATVTVVDENGTTLATVDATVADSAYERYTGLSDTDSLGEDEGMLFVHPETGEHAYVMRDMAFPIDIVFVAADGTVTAIHHAELPPADADDLHRYRGSGKYVLELPYGYTNRTGIGVGDTVHIPPAHRNTDG